MTTPNDAGIYLRRRPRIFHREYPSWVWVVMLGIVGLGPGRAPAEVEWYGYYHTSTSFGNGIGEVAPHTNLNHVSGTRENLELCRDTGTLALVDTRWQFFLESLRDDWQVHWTILADEIRPLIDHVGGFYVMDEPYWNGISFEDLEFAVARIKETFPGKPVMTTLAWPVVNEGLTLPGNLARSPSTTLAASGATGDNPVLYAADGTTGTIWNSGGPPPQWISLNLGQEEIVGRIRLHVEQFPEGETTHRLWFTSEPGGEPELVHTWSQITRSGDVLEFSPDPPRRASAIRVESTSSPSWIAWKEVEIFRP